MADLPVDLQGKLLVAKTDLVDPNFNRTGGARPGPWRPGCSRPRTQPADHHPLGGTAAGVGGAGLRTVRGVRGRASVTRDHLPGPGASEVSVPNIGYLPLQGTLGTVDLEGDPTSMAPWLEELRIFAGYAGWGAGQLEEELAAGAWWALEAEDERRLQRRAVAAVEAGVAAPGWCAGGDGGLPARPLAQLGRELVPKAHASANHPAWAERALWRRPPVDTRGLAGLALPAGACSFAGPGRYRRLPGTTGVSRRPVRLPGRVPGRGPGHGRAGTAGPCVTAPTGALPRRTRPRAGTRAPVPRTGLGEASGAPAPRTSRSACW